MEVWHTYDVIVWHTYGVVGLVTGANSSSSPSIGRREPQDPGPPDLLHTNLNPGICGDKIFGEKKEPNMNWRKQVKSHRSR